MRVCEPEDGGRVLRVDFERLLKELCCPAEAFVRPLVPVVPGLEAQVIGLDVVGASLHERGIRVAEQLHLQRADDGFGDLILNVEHD